MTNIFEQAYNKFNALDNWAKGGILGGLGGAGIGAAVNGLEGGLIGGGIGLGVGAAGVARMICI